MALDFSIIGQRIKKYRVNKHLTQEQLAEELNVSLTYVSRIECGNAHINLTRLSEVCQILGVDEGTIINGTSKLSKNYLSNEFSNLLNGCSNKTQKLIYDVAKAIINNEQEQKN